MELEAGPDEVRIEGTAVLADPSSLCFDMMLYGRSEVWTPPLREGVYVVRAGSLVQSMTVTGDPTGPRARFVCRGRIYSDSTDCALWEHTWLTVVMSDVPKDLPRGRDYLVHGAIVDEDPCAFAGSPIPIDYFVAVRHVAPLE